MDVVVDGCSITLRSGPTEVSRFSRAFVPIALLFLLPVVGVRWTLFLLAANMGLVVLLVWADWLPKTVVKRSADEMRIERTVLCFTRVWCFRVVEVADIGVTRTVFGSALRITGRDGQRVSVVLGTRRIHEEASRLLGADQSPSLVGEQVGERPHAPRKLEEGPSTVG